MSGLTLPLISLVLASLVLIAMLALSIQEQRHPKETLLALIPGTVTALILGVMEMLEALAAEAGSREQAIYIAASVAFIASAALQLRLVFRRVRRARD